MIRCFGVNVKTKETSFRLNTKESTWSRNKMIVMNSLKMIYPQQQLSSIAALEGQIQYWKKHCIPSLVVFCHKKSRSNFKILMWTVQFSTFTLKSTAFLINYMLLFILRLKNNGTIKKKQYIKPVKSYIDSKIRKNRQRLKSYLLDSVTPNNKYICSHTWSTQSHWLL